MNLPNENYIIDFLVSFVMIEELEADKEETSILDEMIDKSYKKIVENYINSIKGNSNLSLKFIGETYNLLLIIYLELRQKTFVDFLEKFSEMTGNDFIELLKKDPALEYRPDLKSMDNVTMPYRDKWNLFILSSSFDEIKPLVIEELRENYKKYLSYIEELELKYKDEILESKKYLLDRDWLFNVVFKDFISREVYDNTGNIYILPMSMNNISIHSNRGNTIAAIGQYIIPYFIEKEKNKILDDDKFFEILKTISDPTRYEIMNLVNNGISSNSALAERFNVSRAAISKQFKNLTESEILILDDTNKTYSINTDIIIKAINNIEADFDIER